MPECPGCQTPYEEGQHYCKQCGRDLSIEPAPTPRCPRCGAEVTAEQNFCHECDAPLKEKQMSPAFAINKNWLLAGAAAIGVIIVLIVVIQFTRQTSPPPDKLAESPVSQEAPTPPGVKPAQPLGPKATEPGIVPKSDISGLQADLERVLNNLKDANLNKDILLYMSTISLLYPEMDKKRQDILKNWEKFDFKSMTYTVSKIRDLGDNDAVAEVNWSTLSQNRANKNLQTDDFRYRVWFAKELGQWKIKKIEEIED
ncbi:MAG TPA: hypothetical protein DCY27_03340 [Desulfobacterales bacterium]|nr:hypothetical protein [Desulfobacterales bacterium]